MASPTLAQQERSTLCDLLVERGPDAPTLCEGWLTADLAAHLVVRERRPDSGPGLFWPQPAGDTDKVRKAVRDRTLGRSYRDGAAWPAVGTSTLRWADEHGRVLIDVEDVRRAEDAWEPRSVSTELDDALWRVSGARWRSLSPPPSSSPRRDGPTRSAAPGRAYRIGRPRRTHHVRRR